jgi:hypothetical protein
MGLPDLSFGLFIGLVSLLLSFPDVPLLALAGSLNLIPLASSISFFLS